MATLNQIMQKKWPGFVEGMEEDDYESITWIDPAPGPIPEEAECRAWSDYVDWMLGCDALWEAKQDTLIGGPGGSLKAMLPLAQTIIAIRDVILILKPGFIPDILVNTMNLKVLDMVPVLPPAPPIPQSW